MLGTPLSAELVKKEFYRSTERFHVIATWVGIILNLVWFVSDIFILPDYSLQFILFRVVVSGLSAVVLLTKKWTKRDIYFCMFFLVTGISIQNAYMWSVMDLVHLQKHAFAYMVLFIGVGMLVLWELRYSVFLLLATVISNIIFYELNSSLSIEEFLISGGLLVQTVAIFCLFLIRTRYRLTINEIRSRMELARSRDIIEQEKATVSKQKEELHAKNKEITDSINYAQRIQTSFLPNESKFKKSFKDCFVLFRPKDILSGDFYWIYETGNRVYYATADCTGHGVPGGFMTMLGLSLLEEIVPQNPLIDPASVLNVIRLRIVNALKQSGKAEESKDGMDLVLCCIDRETMKLTYAAANNSFYILRKNEDGKINLAKKRGERQPCGFYPESKPFQLYEEDLHQGDLIYTFTDGYPDQFGGEKGKKFRYKQFEELILKNWELPFPQQRAVFDSTIETWRGRLEQVDDILVIGIKI